MISASKDNICCGMKSGSLIPLTACMLSTYWESPLVAAVSLGASRVDFMPPSLDQYEVEYRESRNLIAPPNQRPLTCTQNALTLSPLIMPTDLSDSESLGPSPSITYSRTDAFLVGAVIVAQ